MKRWFVVCFFAALLAVPVMAAGSKTAIFHVKASVPGNCVVTVPDFNLGTYDAVAANATSPLTATGTVSVQCTKGASASLDLDGGVNLSGGVRRMTDGTDFLTYGIYQDAAYTTVWGTGVTGGTAEAYNSTNTLTVTSLTMYGTVPAGQAAGVGNYSDTVTLTINY